VKIVPLGPDHWEWATAQTGASWSTDTRGLVAVDKADRPVGAVVLYGWTDSAVSAHFAVTNPLALRPGGLFDETYKFVFETCDRIMMLGATPSDKPKALKLVKHLGWETIYRLPDGWAVGVDMVYSRFSKVAWQVKRAA